MWYNDVIRMPEDDMKEKDINTSTKKNKKAVIIIIICLAAALIVCGALISIINAIENDGGEFGTYPPIDPSKLHETKAEDFDIMEYEEYLGLDRNIYLNNKQTGVMQSVTREEAHLHGEGFEVMFYVMTAINEGDNTEYNYYMGKKSLEKGGFTQQQIYDIEIVPHEYEKITDGGVLYEEYTFKVTYRIHENNGTYRNNVESDVSRPQYFIVNDSTGSFKVMDILEPGYTE